MSITLADRVVIALAGLVIGASAALFWRAGDAAATTLEVRQASALSATLLLKDDQHLRVEGPLGASLIELAGGRARIAASPCPGQHCVTSGWVTKAGDLAVCVPNRVLIVVGAHEMAYDAIHF